MSIPVVKVTCLAIMAIMGVFIVKRISGSNESLLKLKSLVLMLCLIILPAVIYDLNYSYMFSIIVYSMTIITYKYMLNIGFPKTIISCSIMMLMIVLLDSIISGIVVFFVSFEEARSGAFIPLLSSVLVTSITLYIFNIRSIREKIVKFISKLENKKTTNFVIFFILIVIAICIVLYVISNNFKLNAIFTTSFLILIIFYLLVIILINEKSNYDKLLLEYDGLYNYVKIFEDWIESEQLSRHEYKNQLAVLRCMTKDKKVISKIDSIINDNINIDSKMINQLKYIPNGGFKGLLYYKIVIARNQKVNIDVDVSSNVSSKLKNLSFDELKIVSNLIGIYCDNAIEAAKETIKKLVLIEIYAYSNDINIVISNTYNNKKNISNRYQKGFSTKGENRGNGLYFANKIISRNKWIEEQQEMIDNLYIQKLIIKKSKRKEK